MNAGLPPTLHGSRIVSCILLNLLSFSWLVSSVHAQVTVPEILYIRTVESATTCVGQASPNAAALWSNSSQPVSVTTILWSESACNGTVVATKSFTFTAPGLSNPQLLDIDPILSVGQYGWQLLAEAGTGLVSPPVCVPILVRGVESVSIAANATTACVGENRSLSAVVASSDPGPLTFAWYRDGQLLNGPTSTSVLALSAISLSNTATYSVVVTGACTSMTSAAFNLTVNSSPTRLYVKANATGLNTGLSWDDAFTDLQSALTYPCSQSLTEIWVASGVYKPTSNTADQGASFVLKNGIALYGGFAGLTSETALSDRPSVNPLTGQPSSSTLSGDLRGNDGPDFSNRVDNSLHVIFNNNSGLNNTAVLDGFVISGGNADKGNDSNSTPDSNGGGIYNANGSPLIVNCLLESNRAFYGGGLYLNNSSPTLINCLLQRNQVLRQGGAAYTKTNSSPQLTNCVLQYNTADSYCGAFLSQDNGRPVLTNCTFLSNTAPQGGAIIVQDHSYMNLINCSLLNNSAASVGGVISNFRNGTAVLTNCSLQGNRSPENSIYNDNSVTRLINCVVYGNEGGRTFGNVGNGSVRATYTLFDNTVINYISEPGNLTTTTSPFVSSSSVALAACSPAINAGDPSTTTATVGATDLASQPRIVNGRVDMGAVEYQSLSSVPLVILQQPGAGSAVCAGSTAVVSVSVTGTVTGYQWYNTGTALTGIASATTASLTLTNVQTGNAGNYSVVITGDCPSVTSTAFSLTVNALPTVSLPSASTILTCANPSLTLTAQTSATTFAWSSGGSTSQNLSVNQQGIYSVTVTDGNGCTAVSNSLSISQDLTLSSFSVNSVTVCQGQTVSLLASGCNGQVVWATGATGSSLTVTAGSSTSMLTATCTVGSCRATTSGRVVVSQVLPPPARILSLSTDETTCPVRLLGRATGTSFVFTNARGYVFSQLYRQSGTYDVFALEVTQPGVYTLTAINTNECGSSAPVSQTVTVSRSCP